MRVDGSGPVALEAGRGVGYESIFIRVVAAFFDREGRGVQRDQVIEVGLAMLAAPAAAGGCACARDYHTMRFRHDLDRFDVGDVKVAAEDEIDPQFTGEIEGFPGVPGDIMRSESLYLRQVMVDHQHLEIIGGDVSKEGPHGGALAPSDTSALDGSAVC